MSGSRRTSPSSPSVRRGASIAAGQATVRPGVDPGLVERAFEEELERLGREPVTDDELARARALIETYELEALQRVEERADRLAMYATLLDDPEMINRQLSRYLSVGKAEIQPSRRCAEAGQPGRPDVLARNCRSNPGRRRGDRA